MCTRVDARLLVLLAAMIPRSGESGGQWWDSTGQAAAARAHADDSGRSPTDEFDPVEMFLHDLPPDVRDEALRRPVEQSDGVFRDPWPLTVWPDTPTRVIAGRNDRLFPLAFMQGLSRSRLGIEPDIVDTGHLAALADPEAVTNLLVGYLTTLAES